MFCIVLLFFVVINSNVFVTSQGVRPFLDSYVNEGGAPFLVCLKSIIKNEERKCTGTILDKNWILTLAKCIPQNENEVNITVTANFNSFKDFNVEIDDYQTRFVSHVIVNPYYKPNKLGGADLALLQLQKPLEENDLVNSISVDVEGWPLEDRKPSTRVCEVLGYGDIDHTRRDALLKTRRVRVKHSSDCPCARRNQWLSLCCLDPMEDVGLCPQDDGAPLICNGKLVGLNHMLIVKNNCSMTNYPQDICGDLKVVSYFIYLCPYLNWIKETVVTLPTPTKYCNNAYPFHQNSLLPVLAYTFITNIFQICSFYS